MCPQLHSESLNLYEMFLEVRKNLSETTASYWSDLEVYNKLNQGQKHIAVKSKCLKKTATITTTASTQEYDLNSTTNGFSDIIDIAEDGVYFKMGGTTYQPLKYRTKKQLATEFSGWQGLSASTPQYYYYNKTIKTIGLVPKPNSSNAGAYLFITGYHYPKVLLAGTAAGGSATTITFAAGTSTIPYPNPINDYYNDLYIEIYSNTGAGQRLKITDYVGSSRIATVAWTTQPDATSIYGLVPQISEGAHELMPLYALWKLWSKGGSRTNLANNYRQEYFSGLSDFIGETIEEDDEEIIRDSYRR